jgi:hypothetical protein
MTKRLGYTHDYTAAPSVDIAHLDFVSQAVCKLLADDPFIRASDVCKQLGISVDTYIELSRTIRADSSAQNYVLYQGHGSKYWNNTVRPLLESGSLHAAIDRAYMYPNRVGLYTGMSCMFYCNFCGRNPVA